MKNKKVTSGNKEMDVEIETLKPKKKVTTLGLQGL